MNWSCGTLHQTQASRTSTPCTASCAWWQAPRQAFSEGLAHAVLGNQVGKRVRGVAPVCWRHHNALILATSRLSSQVGQPLQTSAIRLSGWTLCAWRLLHESAVVNLAPRAISAVPWSTSLDAGGSDWLLVLQMAHTNCRLRGWPDIFSNHMGDLQYYLQTCSYICHVHGSVGLLHIAPWQL